MSEKITIDEKIVESWVGEGPEIETTAIKKVDEQLPRPSVLSGFTHKLETPLSSHAIYITINNIVLNSGTEHEIVQPFEIFINSKEMKHYQWVTALTRLISGIFRKGGNVAFMVDELCATVDPNNGYYDRGKWVPSLVAEIGNVIKQHLSNLGLVEGEDPEKERMLAKKREELAEDLQISSSGIEGASVCSVCNARSVVRRDNCEICLNCGDSKCGL